MSTFFQKNREVFQRQDDLVFGFLGVFADTSRVGETPQQKHSLLQRRVPKQKNEIIGELNGSGQQTRKTCNFLSGIV